MYLHLGQETLVKTRDIVGLFDMDNTTTSKWTRAFLNTAEKRGEVIAVTDDLPKTFVVVSKRRGRHPAQKDSIYLSQISAGTLKKRKNYIYTLNPASEGQVTD